MTTMCRLCSPWGEEEVGTENGRRRRSSPQVSFLLAMGSSSIIVWCTFPLVTITSKCLLTSMDECTRWGPMEGANFHYPMTVAAMNLFLVGGFLVLVVMPLVQDRQTRSSSSSSSTHALAIGVSSDGQNVTYGSEGERFECDKSWVNETHHVEGNELTSLSTSSSLAPSSDTDTEDVGRTTRMTRPTMGDKLGSCIWLGIAFGAKYFVSHWALSMTPTLVYDLLHCLVIVVIVICSYVILGETIQSRYQVIGCVGVVCGSVITIFKSSIESASNIIITPEHDTDGSNRSDSTRQSLLMIVLINVLNDILAGLCLVLLRKAMLTSICDSPIEVTAFKSLVGAMFLMPFSLLIEGSVFLSMTWKQFVWLGLSSLAILVYHVNLAILCTLSTSTTVAMIESLRPVPAFGIIVVVQGVHGKKEASFWIGSAVILISTTIYEVPHRLQVGKRRTNQSGTHDHSDGPHRQVRISLPKMKTTLREFQQWRNSRLSSTSPEQIRLLDTGEDANSVLRPTEAESYTLADTVTHARTQC